MRELIIQKFISAVAESRRMAQERFRGSPRALSRSGRGEITKWRATKLW